MAQVTASTPSPHVLDGASPRSHRGAPPHRRWPCPAPSPPKPSLQSLAPRPAAITFADYAASMDALESALVDGVNDLWAPAMTVAELVPLNIQCQTLELSGQTPFFRPIALLDMRLWIEEKRPWLARGHGYGHDPDLNRWYNARKIADNLTSYAEIAGKTEQEFDKHLPGIMDEFSQWTGRRRGIPSVPSFEGMKDRNDYYDFQGKFTLLNLLHPKDVILPHITGILCSSARLDDATIERVELIALFWLMQCRVLDHRYDTLLIPVSSHLGTRDEFCAMIADLEQLTLISTADHCCRLITGHFDAVQKRIILQKSKIIDLDYENHHDSDDWMHIMCWMLAEPIGNIKIAMTDVPE
ncbi:hypothetical protein ANO11243_092120 [Dothideomycetidae sp. 11243]|nr:hypothetical protein ANO11243_092120 [fungal sp. No.11243]